jgi:hypothetical protein
MKRRGVGEDTDRGALRVEIVVADDRNVEPVREGVADRISTLDLRDEGKRAGDRELDELVPGRGPGLAASRPRVHRAHVHGQTHPRCCTSAPSSAYTHSPPSNWGERTRTVPAPPPERIAV